jgi:dipeptidase D
MGLSTIGARLAKLDGGNKRNAIPRETLALVFIPKKNLEAARDIVGQYNKMIKAEFATVEKDLNIGFAEKPGVKKGKVIKKALQKKLFTTLVALPHGVLKMSADISWLVETSTNVAVINTTNKAITLATSQRSSVASELEEAVQTVASVLELGGADVETSDGYPGWKPDMNSHILKVAKNSYKKLYGKGPDVKAIHAGLECGIIGERYPGMDMVSMGPTMEGVHSPDERLHISTVDKFYTYLLEILKSYN